MNRSERRKIKRTLTKEQEILERKKENLRRKYNFQEDPFKEVNEYKKYGPLVITKNGLKAAPSVTYKIWGVMLRFNYNYIAFAILGYVFKYRKKLKPGMKRFEVTKYEKT